MTDKTRRMDLFGIATLNYLRPRVFELWCAQIKRLRDELGLDFPVVCVSEASDKATCDKYNIVHFTHLNKPVSLKWNVAFEYLKNKVDYVMILDSDDICSTDLIGNSIIEMEKGTSLIGIDTVYFYCGQGNERGKLVCLKSKGMLGIVKSIHKDILDKVEWRPFRTPKNWAINAIATNLIRPYVTTRAIVRGVCVDVKTQMNINKYTCFGHNRKCVPVDSSIFYNILSEEEKFLLDEIGI